MSTSKRKPGRPATVDYQQAVELAKQGKTRRRIAEATGAHYKTVCGFLKTAGIDVPDGRFTKPDDPIALTGGRWVVGRHGVRRWVKDVAA